MISWRFGRRRSEGSGTRRVVAAPSSTGTVSTSQTAVSTGTAAPATTPERASPTPRGARIVLVAVISLGIVHVVFMLGVETLRYFRSEAAITRLEQEVNVLEAEAAQLQSIIEHGDDISYREQLARRQGYMYPDETRIVTDEILFDHGLMPPERNLD